MVLLHVGHTARGAAEVALTVVGAGLSLGGLVLGLVAVLRRAMNPAPGDQARHVRQTSRRKD
jgi:hypothetical protein